MKAINRYIALCLGLLVVYIFYLAIFHHDSSTCFISTPSQRSHFNLADYIVDRKSYYSAETLRRRVSATRETVNITKHRCRMDSCFDFSRCQNMSQAVKIYIYPIDEQYASPTFMQIVNIIKDSKYYEPDPEKACLFISDIDTLDRDPLSSDYQRHTSIKPLLYGGRNHIVFNLFSGTWPIYSEIDFTGIDFPSYALLVKASMSYEHYRKGFDVALPLFKGHPERGPQYLPLESNKISFGKSDVTVVKQSQISHPRYLLVFKGKRYVYGIGSETRNALHHLHNDKDILIFTTCKHGKKWKELVDSRCEQDNLAYERFEYRALMTNSTFCLVPRGRRLDSFRFLEALSMGCIPVVLSNSLVLPFSEVIDWSAAVIIADERLLLQIPDQLRSISQLKIQAMRAQCIYLYNTYFSSIEHIVRTALSIIEDRIRMHWAKESFLWNVANRSPISPLWLDRSYSDQVDKFPSYSRQLPDKGFTALITISRVISIHQLSKFLKASLLTSKFVRMVVIVWSLRNPVPGQLMQLASTHSSLISFISSVELNDTQSSKFNCCLNTNLVSTDAIFQLDPESNLIPEELDFAYLTWLSFPERVVGFTARDHYFDSTNNQWSYTSKWTNQFSIILLDAAIYHKYYNFLYTQHLISNAASLANHLDEECSAIAFNFLVSHITRQSPIKVTQRKKTVNSETLFSSWMAWIDRKSCFQRLVDFFGYIPLVKSKIRLEPLLYKDQVSSMRKKYRKMETIL